MFPSADFADDGIGVGGPHEGFGIVIGLAQEAVDGGLQIGDAFEDAALQPTPGQLGKEALDRVEPGSRGRGEVEMKALVSTKPSLNPGLHRGRLLGCLCVA